MAADIEFLKSLAYFSGLSDEKLDSIRKSLFEKSSDRGEIIMLEGEPSGEIYFVVSGVVKLLKTSAEGKEQILSIIRPGDSFRVMGKESILGLINGLTLGCLLGLVAWLWIDSPLIGLVIGFAMAANTVVSAVVGGSVPLLLKRCGVDPALVSSPILTTVTDMCGFFLVLGSATLLLPFLR